MRRIFLHSISLVRRNAPYHQVVLNAVEEAVADKYNYMRIDGSTPAKTRQANVENFQKDDTIRIAILSLMAAGTGVTLTRVSECVFVALIEEEIINVTIALFLWPSLLVPWPRHQKLAGGQSSLVGGVVLPTQPIVKCRV